MNVSKKKAIDKLNSLVDTASRLIGASTSDAEFKKWKNDCLAALRNIFGQQSHQYGSFNSVRYSPFAVTMGGDNSAAFKQSYTSGLSSAVAALKSQRDEVSEFWPDDTEVFKQHIALPAMASKEVFIVHGHDIDRAEVVARFVERRGLTATILHEQPNLGNTIIEKFERHAKPCGFAIVLLTPDDEGRVAGEPTVPLQPRARQNVILEMGYFLHALGRSRVAVLHAKGVELPSDVSGVLYTSLDEMDWKTKLEQEMKAAGVL